MKRVGVFLFLLLHFSCKKEPQLREAMLFTLSVKDNLRNDLLDTNYVNHFPWSEISWTEQQSGEEVSFTIQYKYGAFLLENTSKIRENLDYFINFPAVAPQKFRFEFSDYQMQEAGTGKNLTVRAISKVYWNDAPLIAEKGYFEITLTP
ncbi:hypothetical protein [Schleiferia thermophila]|uniref:Uncharacterized protein n=1 Tax=Schleiferia thermophila TaxID=884107 RepID=A0A369A8V0_9FLAO|nr:hypothetical protein [Schleiferia thermophila]RCX05551.1 hypothetical protein DES35_101838 [Schleiferia thermophila]GCD78955.1 hypothetical protein JCM30197_02020 [Schleiferia thermophila]